MAVSMIVAMTPSGGIGINGGLPWKIREDLDRVKMLTGGKTLIMGRRTFQSLPKLLPTRRHIVVTSDPNFSAEGVEVARSVEEAIAMESNVEIFIFGGESIYREAFKYADTIYVTMVMEPYECDTFFPIDLILDNRREWTTDRYKYHEWSEHDVITFRVRRDL